MNFSLITRLEKTSGLNMSAWELSQMLQWKLAYRMPNLSIPEVEQLEHVLAHYKDELRSRNGMPTENSVAVAHDRRAEVLIAECALAATNSESAEDYQLCRANTV